MEISLHWKKENNNEYDLKACAKIIKLWVWFDWLVKMQKTNDHSYNYVIPLYITLRPYQYVYTYRSSISDCTWGQVLTWKSGRLSSSWPWPETSLGSSWRPSGRTSVSAPLRHSRRGRYLGQGVRKGQRWTYEIQFDRSNYRVIKRERHKNVELKKDQWSISLILIQR